MITYRLCSHCRRVSPESDGSSEVWGKEKRKGRKSISKHIMPIEEIAFGVQFRHNLAQRQKLICFKENTVKLGKRTVEDAPPPQPSRPEKQKIEEVLPPSVLSHHLKFRKKRRFCRYSFWSVTLVNL